MRVICSSDKPMFFQVLFMRSKLLALMPVLTALFANSVADPNSAGRFNAFHPLLPHWLTLPKIARPFETPNPTLPIMARPLNIVCRMALVSARFASSLIKPMFFVACLR